MVLRSDANLSRFFYGYDKMLSGIIRIVRISNMRYALGDFSLLKAALKLEISTDCKI